MNDKSMGFPTASEDSNTADAVIAAVHGYGVDTIFGIPGLQTYHLYDAIAKTGTIRAVQTRHEQAAGYMAFGYAKATGKLGVATAVPGPGVLNASAALLTANSTSTPVLCLAGQIPSAAIGRGFDSLHELPDQKGTLGSFLKWADRVDGPDEATSKATEALRQAVHGRPGVATLELPMDVQGMPAPTLPFPGIGDDPLAAELDEDTIREAAKILGGAKNPIIFVGAGAAGAAEALTEVAHILGAPVVSFRNGRGIVSDRDPFSFNVVAGYRIWKQADVVLAVGTRFELPNVHWGGISDKKVVRIDIDKSQAYRYGAADATIVADANLALTAMVPHLTHESNGAPAGVEDRLMALKASAYQDIQTVQPQVDILNAIRAALPDDGIFVDEVTQVGYTSWYHMPTYAPRTYISSGYQGNLGYGYATALGAKVGEPDKAVVSIAGDGGFMFNVQEIATAVQHNLNVVNIVFNNGRYGNVARDQDRLFEGRRIASDLANPDFVKLAESFGAQGVHVKTPDELRTAIENGLAASGPVLIEMPLEGCATPWPIMFPEGYSPYLEDAAKRAPMPDDPIFG